MSTDDTSTYSQVQLVPANGSSSDNKSDINSCRKVAYEDLIRNTDLFWHKLRDLLQDSGRILKIPTVGGESFDLHRLFIEVTARGGIEKVIKDRKCKEVIQTFGFRTAVTNAAYLLRNNYLKTLFEFEHVYFFQEPISSFSAREEALKRLVEKSAYHGKGTQEVQPGCLVNGIIDGKFDDGYFVTMKIGSEDFKGVLYKFPETERREKKSKLSQVDPYRPKFHRSGYNFFFSEKYRRLKPEYAGQEPLLKKDNGYMWNNVSESDRHVYQEKGHEDVERYNPEMSEYRTFINSCGAENVAAIDAATATATAAEAEDEDEASL